jgi:septation ring formation regulator EzrA
MLEKEFKEKDKTLQSLTNKLNLLTGQIGPIQNVINSQSHSQDAINMVKNYENKIEGEMLRWGNEWGNRMKDVGQRMSKIEEFCSHIQK